MSTKGTACVKMYGNSNATRKLDSDDVVLIRALWRDKQYHLTEAKKITLKGIGEKFGIHPRNVEKIVYYETWRHVKD